MKQPPPVQEDDGNIPAINPAQPVSDPEPVEQLVVRETDDELSTESGKTATAAPTKSRQVEPIVSSMRAGSKFLATKYEKLTCQISMLGIPVGSADLEAKNENGDTSIVLKVQSNAAITTIYPVDDSVETRAGSL